MKKLFIGFSMFLILLSMFFLTGCSTKKYNIGVIGKLSGSLSSHTEYGYQTIRYYAENSQIASYNVYPIDILTYTNSEDLIEYINSLDLNFIFGPFLSSELLMYYDELSELDIPIFVSTASTDEIFNVDDNVFRLIKTTNQQAASLANYIVSRDALVVDIYYDLSNAAYSLDYAESISAILNENSIANTLIPVGDIHDGEFDVEITNQDTAIIIADSSNTGLLTQMIKSQSTNIDVFWAAWANSQETIVNATTYANGCFVLSDTYTNNTDKAREINLDVFNEDSNILHTSTFHHYEMFLYFEYILQNVKNPTLENIKDFVYQLDSFQGDLSSYQINNYGEGERNYWIMKVENNIFSEVEEIG